MNVKLTKLYSTHNRVRTNIIIGQCESWPAVGQSFTMTAPPLHIAYGMRVVVTTPIVELEGSERLCVFKTHNSTYRLERV